MWTYLVIFFGFALLIGIFLRKLFLYLRKNIDKKSVENEADEEKLSSDPKRRLSHSDKEQVDKLFEKGEAQLKVGKEDEAIKCFVQALAINGLHVETLHKLAMLYMKKQMYGAASALFKNLGEITGEALHYSNLGLALFQQNLFEEAKGAYHKSVELDDSRAPRFISLAQVYRSLGELNNAVIALNKAVDIDKENMDYLLFLADVQAELGNLGQAIEVINGVLEIEPNCEEAKAFLKTLRLEKKRRES